MAGKFDNILAGEAAWRSHQHRKGFINGGTISSDNSPKPQPKWLPAAYTNRHKDLLQNGE
jgi:hypothetical protein